MDLDLLVFGDTAIDRFYEVDKIPKNNEASDVSSAKRFYGGMGANTAVVAKSLGLNVGLVSVIGTDADDYKNYMIHQGIKMYLKGIFGDTTKSMFYKSENGLISFFYKGVTSRLDELNPQQEFGKTLPKDVKYVYMARTYLKMQTHVVKQFKDSIKVYNPGYGTFKFEKAPRAFKKVMREANYVVLNEHEIHHLKSIGYVFKARPKQTLIITRGDKGARIHTRDSQIDVPIYKTDAVDASGAGDAFNAGFIAARIKDYDLIESVRFANAAASYIVEEWGCQTNLPSFNQAYERYKGIK